MDNTELLKLREQGLSFTQIAKQLGLTKGAVAGRIKRMRDRKDIGPPPPKPKPVTKELTSKVVMMKPNRYTIRTRPFNYQDVSKAELREQLHRAVLNTK